VGIFPVPADGVNVIVANFDQLHQLLTQSLREFQDGSSDSTDPQEQELSQALHQLTGRLNEILAATADPSLSSECVTGGDRFPALTAPTSLTGKPHIHFVTSCEGVVLMANDAVCEVLGIDLARMGTVSVAEFVPQEEWRMIRNRLYAGDLLQGSASWRIWLCPSGGPSRKVECLVTPMFDHSRKVTAWHWGVTLEPEPSSAQPFFQLMQTLEAQLFAGQSMDALLTQICEGLMHTFGFPFVWAATVRKGYGVQLRAQAVTAGLDWETHGLRWWEEVSRQEGVARACAASDVILISRECPQPDDMAWFPRVFQLHDTLCVPLACPGDLSGVLVVCSARPHVFDATVTGWLRVLGDQIERLMRRGKQLEQWRLHSAVIGSVNDAVCVTDPHGHLEWVNDAYTALLGSATQEILGSPLSTFPHAQLQSLSALDEYSAKDLSCVKTEVMQTGRNGESLVFEQVVTPLVNERGQLTHFVVILHDVTARKTQELLMKHQAYHDPLTDLPNRMLFEDRLQQGLAHARRNGALLALFFLDLDNFKPINDQYGHHIGDRVLRVVAKRLATCVRSTDTVARLCGDEFTVILQGLDRIQDIRQVAQKILECLTPPVRWGGQEIPIQISIGIAVYPKDSTNPHQLLEIADHAMYRAKECGGQCWYFATTEWNAE
jgi:diguanylate cyclase (GGDEF)-like protein/PAS domain S-box-containing protein